MNEPGTSIAALATPPGEGALAIIRLSGSLSEKALLSLAGSARQLSDFPPRKLCLTVLHDTEGRAMDQALLVRFPAPDSYTGEDMLEIHIHGGQAGAQVLLRVLQEMGVREASPGEFSYRAFLNGKMDLLQAEAVSELIAGQSREARRLSLSQVQGGLSAALLTCRRRLFSLLRDLEAEIDFPEDPVELLSREKLQGELLRVSRELDRILGGAEGSRLLLEGVDVVLAGEPNGGKSTIFNTLLGEERAIVTSEAGTTRDSLREYWLLRGLPLRLHDTAGLREVSDPVEKEGVRRSEELLEFSRIRVWVLDGCLPASKSTLSQLSALRPGNDLIVINKSDLPDFDPSRFSRSLPPGLDVLELSALNGSGMEKLQDKLYQLALGTGGQESLEVEYSLNRRQEGRLLRCREILSELLDTGAALDVESELLARSLREAVAELDELSGQEISEEVLADIFSSFCIGK